MTDRRPGDVIRVLADLAPDDHELASALAMLGYRRLEPDHEPGETETVPVLAASTDRTGTSGHALTPAPERAAVIGPHGRGPIPTSKATSVPRIARTLVASADLWLGGSATLALVAALVWPAWFTPARVTAALIGMVWILWRSVRFVRSRSLRQVSGAHRSTLRPATGRHGPATAIPVDERPRGAQPPPASLVAWSDRRGLIPLLTETWGRGDDVDVDALVHDMATGRPIQLLPRRLRRSHVNGYIVVVDRSAAMVPFLHDLDELLAAAAGQLGGGTARTLCFSGDLRAGIGASLLELEPPERLLPRAGGRALIATDLALGRDPSRAAGTVEGWASSDRWLRGRGIEPLYLVPYPPERWARLPPSLAGRALWWDGLTDRSARRVVG